MDISQSSHVLLVVRQTVIAFIGLCFRDSISESQVEQLLQNVLIDHEARALMLAKIIAEAAEPASALFDYGDDDQQQFLQHKSDQAYISQRKLHTIGKRGNRNRDFISEFAPPKVHVLPVCISHLVAFIAFGYRVPLVIEYGLHLLRHGNMHRLDFSEA